jgi:CheY-like chemotaxis protein
MSRVYVVDDDLRHAKLAAKIIERTGNEVEVFGDPIEALHAACEKKPDLMVVDMMMPEIDGLGLLRVLRKKGVDSKAVIVSAYATEVDKKLVPANGVEAVVSKPYPIKQLMDVVIRALSDSGITVDAVGNVEGGTT